LPNRRWSTNMVPDHWVRPDYLFGRFPAFT